MFGLSLGGQLIQGSAERTWNCISQIANLVWYKFNNLREPIMPRQRRRHYSRSRSRSRSHSHDKDREVKRRKIEQFDSPVLKRSVSPADGASTEEKKTKIQKEERRRDSEADSIESKDIISLISDNEQSPVKSEKDATSKKVVSIASDGNNSRDNKGENSEEKGENCHESGEIITDSVMTSDVITIDSDNSQEPTSLEKSSPDPKKKSSEKAFEAIANSTPKPHKTIDTSQGSSPSEAKSKPLPKQIPIEKAIKEMSNNPSPKSQTESDAKAKLRQKQNPIERALRVMANSAAKIHNKDENVEESIATSDVRAKLRPKPNSEKASSTSEQHNSATEELHSKDEDVQESITTADARAKLRPKTNSEKASSTSEKHTESNVSEVDEGTCVEKSTTPKSESKMKEHPEVNVNESTPRSSHAKRLPDEDTPSRKLTPKQIQKKMESEKKRLEKEKEREEREKQKQEEKDKKEAEKLMKKELKQKEIEQKQKEKEEKEEQKKREKEQKKIEKEQKEEQKRKEKEEEKLKKQQEIDEKNKEKQKEEEKKQKAKAAFASFFVPKRTTEEKRLEDANLAFMPFEIKSDMRLPLLRRQPLTDKEKDYLVHMIENNNPNLSYLADLKKCTELRTCGKTWPCEDVEDDEVTIIEDEEIVGETICKEKPTSERMRAKFLKFHENQRPAYYGTWRKKSKSITGRRPLEKETIFDYEVDSDDDWEEEEQGENLEVVSDDDKENEAENEDYEVDNEFFVPHGHLSDDEVDDEETSILSPESQKLKLQLLKDAFDQDIKSKTHKIIPRSIGCIWYNKDGDNVDEAINRYLQPLNIITNGSPIDIKKRDINSNIEGKKKKSLPDIPEDLMPVLMKIVHGNTVKRQKLVEEFLSYVKENNADLNLPKAGVSRLIRSVANWTKNLEMKKLCWMVKEEVAEKYSFDLALPNVRETVKGDSKA